MSSRLKNLASAKPRHGKSITIGRDNFAKISAVDDIRLTPEMMRDFREFDRRGLAPDERRREINSKYGKKPT